MYYKSKKALAIGPTILTIVALVLTACGAPKVTGTSADGYPILDTDDSSKACEAYAGQNVVLKNGIIVTCPGAATSNTQTGNNQNAESTPEYSNDGSNTNVDPGSPPFQTKEVKNGKGVTVTALVGFDVKYPGASDAGCGVKELELIHIGEVVGSQDEPCQLVTEWSLKVGPKTILAGVYVSDPREWYYVPLAVSGLNDSPRIVGTIWYLPRTENSHQFALNLAGDRDGRDGTLSYVGLSPTDDWVVKVAESLK